MLHRLLGQSTRSLVAGALLLTFAWQPAAAMRSGLHLPGDPAAARLLAAEQAQVDLTNADWQVPLTTEH